MHPLSRRISRMTGPALLICLLLSLSACTGTRISDGYGEDIEFIILQLNDVYEISPLDDGRSGGMARVAQIRKDLMSANPNVITVLNGDYLNPSLIGSLKCDFGTDQDRINGRQMVETMNALGVDYVTFGNHEFDLKEPDVIARIDESDFRIVSSNVLHKSAEGDRPFQQDGKDIPRYLVHKLKSPRGTELRIGLLGLTINSNPVDYVTYLDPYTEGQKAVDALRPQSDVVIALTHLTMSEDKKLAGKLEGVPLLLGGHEHIHMSAEVGGSSVWKADANAKTVYIHWCKYNTKTKKLSHYAQLMPVTDLLDEDQQVAEVVGKWEEFANECMEEQGYNPTDTIGKADPPLDGREESIRFQQTNLGALIADAMQAADVGAELAFFNSGSIRLDDQISGYILERDILGTLPFGGGIAQGEMKGSDLKRFLDAGLDPSLHGNGAYQQLSSNISPQKEGGYLINGQELDPERTYQVVTAAFLAGGGEPALEFIKDLAEWKDPDIPDASPYGAPKNDVRDIVIWFLRNQQ